MKAIIVASGTLDMLEPSRNWVPEMLIPIGNKPVLEYQLEWLYNHGITDVKVVMRHMPYETRRYVRDGARWGCKITYAIGRDDLNLCSALRFFSDVSEEGLICLPARFLTTLHLEELMARHRSMENDITISVPSPKGDDSPVEELELASIEPFPVSILSPNAQQFIQNSPTDEDLILLYNRMMEAEFKVSSLRSDEEYWYVNSLERLWELQKNPGKLTNAGFRLRGWQIDDDIWVGMNTRIHPSAQLEAPLIIGDNVSIERGVHLGRGSVLGNDVVVDSNSSVLTSMIMRGTYIGSNVDIHDSMVYKNCLVSMPEKVKTLIHDSFMLGDVRVRWYSGFIAQYLHALIALALLVFFSPVIVGDLLIRIFQGKRALSAQLRTTTRVKRDLSGAVEPVFRKLYLMSGGVTLLDRLPGLWNVVKGDLRLVGMAPLREHEYEDLDPTWQIERSECPTGLFQLWDADGIRNPDPVERLVSERYYLRTRTFRGDLLLFFKVFWEMISRPFRETDARLGDVT